MVCIDSFFSLVLWDHSSPFCSFWPFSNGYIGYWFSAISCRWDWIFSKHDLVSFFSRRRHFEAEIGLFCNLVYINCQQWFFIKIRKYTIMIAIICMTSWLSVWHLLCFGVVLSLDICILLLIVLYIASLATWCPSRFKANDSLIKRTCQCNNVLCNPFFLDK